jgi:hypothetical protein
MVAEGSDWFWWYGEDHQTDNAAEFDELFRGRLKKVYRLLGEEPPLRLDEPIKKAVVGVQYRLPAHTMTPRLDGRVTDYFEWLSAGFAVPAGGAMHRAECWIDRVFFGFDLGHLYLRIDAASRGWAEFPRTCSLHVQFVSPEECRLALEHEEDGAWRLRTVRWPPTERPPRLAGGKILEMGIPLEALGVREPADILFFVEVLDNGKGIERFPSSGFLTVHLDPWSLDQQEWLV